MVVQSNDGEGVARAYEKTIGSEDHVAVAITVTGSTQAKRRVGDHCVNKSACVTEEEVI
jgi:hypothetical protein